MHPNNVRASGAALGATSYQHTEDFEVIGDKLFVAITEGPVTEDTDIPLYIYP